MLLQPKKKSADIVSGSGFGEAISPSVSFTLMYVYMIRR